MHRRFFSAFTKTPLVLTALAVAFILPLITLPEFAHADISNTRNDSWGTQELSGSGWFSGSGVNVYSNGASIYGPSPDTYNCFPIAGGIGNLGCPNGSDATGIKWQCVELVNRLSFTQGWITSTWSGNGNSIISSLPAGFTSQNNDHISYINVGDIITFDQAGTTGHAGIVNTVGGTIQTVNQNIVSVYANTSVTAGSLATATAHLSSYLPGYSVQSIIHHPGGTPPPPPPVISTLRTSPTSDGHIQTFKATNDTLSESWYDWGDGTIGGWTQPAAAPAGIIGTPTLVARPGQSVIDVFVRGGTNNQVYETWYDWGHGNWGG